MNAKVLKILFLNYLLTFELQSFSEQIARKQTPITQKHCCSQKPHNSKKTSTTIAGLLSKRIVGILCLDLWYHSYGLSEPFRHPSISPYPLPGISTPAGRENLQTLRRLTKSNPCPSATGSESWSDMTTLWSPVTMTLDDLHIRLSFSITLKYQLGYANAHVIGK